MKLIDADGYITSLLHHLAATSRHHYRSGDVKFWGGVIGLPGYQEESRKGSGEGNHESGIITFQGGAPQETRKRRGARKGRIFL